MTQLTVCIVGIMFLGSCQLGISDCGTSDKTRFYEVSGDVYSMIDRLQDYGKVLDNSNGTENATFVNQVMMVLDQIELSKTCKFYTEVMTYKHKLSHYVFNNATLTSNYTTKLTLLMINLQTAAVKLQNIKMEISHQACIEFTAVEYEQIYRSYEKGRDVLRALKNSADMWRNQFVNNPCTFN